jgi:putative thioredoxin
LSTPSFSRPGAIDLSMLSQPQAAPSAGAAAGTGSAAGATAGAYAVDVTEAGFATDVVEASMQHLVVLALWSTRSPASIQVTNLFTELSDEYQGRFALARADVDALPQVAQAIGAQGVPFLVALLRGQPVAQIPATNDPAEAREILDQLTQAALANGITGRAAPRSAPAAPADDDAPAEDPRFAAADAALARDDVDAAVAAYRALVAANPADKEAAERLAGVELMARTRGVDPATARQAAAERPDDVDAQALVADLDVLGGHIDDALTRMVDTVARTAGDERDRARAHLLSLFEVVGTDDPAVATARRRLAAALF